MDFVGVWSKFWADEMREANSLAGFEARQRTERVVFDIQISAGIL